MPRLPGVAAQVGARAGAGARQGVRGGVQGVLAGGLGVGERTRGGGEEEKRHTGLLGRLELEARPVPRRPGRLCGGRPGPWGPAGGGVPDTELEPLK